MRLLKDLTYALRMLGRNPALTVIAILTLGLGIGANSAIFSAVYAFTMKPLPYPNGDRIVSLFASNQARSIASAAITPAEYRDLKDVRNFATSALFRNQGFSLVEAGQPAFVRGFLVTPEIFDVIGVKAAKGRLFEHERDVSQEYRVAIVSDGLWRREFAARADIVGHEIKLNGANYTVVGVLPAAFNLFYEEGDVFVPLRLENPSDRRSRFLRGAALLRTGVSQQQAAAELNSLGERLEREYPDTNRGWRVALISLTDLFLPQQAKTSLWTLFFAVGFVLVIACVNIANLLLARGLARKREIAIRRSLGASRWAIMRLLLVESMTMGLGGGLLGALFAYWGVPLLKSLVTSQVPRLDEIQLNWPTVLYSLLISLFCGVLFGLAPAWLQSSVNLNPAMQDAARGSSGSRKRVLGGLVVVQIALAMLLVAGSGLLIRSLIYQTSMHPGFRTERLMTGRVSLPSSRYQAGPTAVTFFRNAVDQLRQDHRVQFAAAASSVPLSSGSNYAYAVPEGAPPDANGDGKRVVGWNIVSNGYFETLGIAFVSGRDFTPGDDQDHQQVAIVNKTFADRYWPNQDPIGRRLAEIGMKDSRKWITVVGVVSDVRSARLATPPGPEVYRPHAQNPSTTMVLIARTVSDPHAIAGAMRQAVLAQDREQPVYQLESVDDGIHRRMMTQRAVAQVLGFLAVLALLLAAIGIYGVMAYIANQRSHEIGLRLALGASAGHVFSIVAKTGAILTGLGMLIGLPAAVGIAPFLQGILVGIPPHDEVTFAAAALVLVGVSLVAGSLPALKAMRTDPVKVLRYE